MRVYVCVLGEGGGKVTEWSDRKRFIAGCMLTRRCKVGQLTGVDR